jgi:hypothetical protein
MRSLHLKEAITTSPAFDAAFLDAENKDCAALDHSSSLRVVEATSDTWDDALACSMNEAKCMDGGLDIANERRYVWVARHYRVAEFEAVGQSRVVG